MESRQDNLINQNNEAKLEGEYKRKVIAQMFGNIGTIHEDFACALEEKILLQGRMFIASSGICFYSNIFGHEKKLLLPWEGVACVTKEKTALVIPNALAVVTARREYVFRSFWDRNEAYAVLQRRYRAAMGLAPPSPPAATVNATPQPLPGGPPGGGAPPGGGGGGGLRPAAAAAPLPLPLMEAQAAALRKAMVESEGSATGRRRRPRPEPGGLGSESLASLGRPGGQESGSSSGDNDDDGDDDTRRGGGAFPSSSPLFVAALGSPASSLEDMGAQHRNHRPPPPPQAPAAAAAAAAAAPASSPARPAARRRGPGRARGRPTDEGQEPGPWAGPTDLERLMAAKEAGGAMTTLAAARFPGMGPRGFHGAFLADGAAFPLSRFHEKNGDWAVELTPWQIAAPGTTGGEGGGGAGDGVGEGGERRTLRFTTALNAPIGPSSTVTTKQARLRWFGAAGLLMESKLDFADIPNADCFSVLERWVVLAEPPGPDGAEAVTVTVQCHVKFHKNLLWKKIIDSKTRADMKKVFENYMSLAQHHLKKKSAGDQYQDSSSSEDDERSSEEPRGADAQRGGDGDGNGAEEEEEEEGGARRRRRRKPWRRRPPLPWLAVAAMALYQAGAWLWLRWGGGGAAPPPLAAGVAGGGGGGRARGSGGAGEGGDAGGWGGGACRALLREVRGLRSEMEGLKADLDKLDGYMLQNHEQLHEMLVVVESMTKAFDEDFSRLNSQQHVLKNSVGLMQTKLLQLSTSVQKSEDQTTINQKTAEQLGTVTQQLSELIDLVAANSQLKNSHSQQQQQPSTIVEEL